MGILASLWAAIKDVEDKLYTGLSSETIEQLENISFVTFSTPNIATKTVSFVFVKEEKELLDQIMEDLSSISANEKYLAPMQCFQEFYDTIQRVKEKDNIKNGSLAMVRIIEIINQYLNREEK